MLIGSGAVKVCYLFRVTVAATWRLLAVKRSDVGLAPKIFVLKTQSNRN